MKILKKYYTFVLGIIIGIIFIGYGVYAATTYAISSNKVSYTDNSSLGVDNVQAATIGTCSNMDTRLSDIESDNEIITYSAPFTTMPSGYSASAYKLNGMIVLTIVVPAGSEAGWDVSNYEFSLMPELCPSNYINGTYRYTSSSDMNKIFLSLNANGTLYGNFSESLNSTVYVQFVYPAKS